MKHYSSVQAYTEHSIACPTILVTASCSQGFVVGGGGGEQSLMAICACYKLLTQHCYMAHVTRDTAGYYAMNILVATPLTLA